MAAGQGIKFHPKVTFGKWMIWTAKKREFSQFN
jgi:hypothetical protein